MPRLLLFAALALPLAACQSDDAVDETPDVSETVTQDDPIVTAPVGAGTPLNLNTATGEEFATIPGVGDRMVHEFEEYRPYTSIAQFRREIGKYVDEDVVAGYEEYVFVPISLEASDAETVMQLPGVSAEEAQELVDGQPYASADAFLTAYESIAGAPDAEAARVYLASE